ncbi:MAG: uncharacterized protein A8A55_2260 [Amphiamblys sp. WSBS2006]|nr:MAG: uncharacterized protein A8A55_2260 [Amphiamblys sp. WSBS2006]
MFDLAHEAFAKHGDSFFLEESGGVLLVSKALLEKRHKDIQKKEQSLYEQRQEALEVAKQRVFEEANEEISALVAQLQTPATFSLTPALPNETILLTDQTTVTLSNIEISSQLFLVLLEKTRVTVGESFSIAEHTDNEDCIRESGMARNSPFRLERQGVVSNFALENIKRIPPSSIGCSLKEVGLTETDLINILPKLRIHKDSKVGWFIVTAAEKEHVGPILAQGQTLYVGRVKKIALGGYAVSIVVNLRTNEDLEVEDLILDSTGKEHVAAVLEQEKPFCVGRVKDITLGGYAVSIFPKLGIRKHYKLRELWLNASEEENVSAIPTQYKTICVERVKNINILDYAAGILPKLIIHEDCEVELLNLSANRKEHVAAVLEQEKMFCVERVKNMRLCGYAVSVISKMSIHEDYRVENLKMYAEKEEHVAAVLAQGQTICVGRVKNMGLWGYAANILPKMRIHEDNIMEEFVLTAAREHYSRIFGEEDNSIELRKIRRDGFDVPSGTKKKLRYTLVDGRGKEVEENFFFF